MAFVFRFNYTIKKNIISLEKMFLIRLFFCLPFFIFSQNQTVGVFEYTDDAYEAYTLFSPSRDTYLIDNCGRVVNMWSSNYQTGGAIYLLEDGLLLRTNRVNNSDVFSGGGIGGRLEKINWNGDVVWYYNYNSSTYHQHHDIEPLPNGNILILAWELKTQEEAINMGRDSGLLEDGELWPEHIIEIEPVGTDDANIVWEWHLWDHLIQDINPNLPNYGVVSDHPELLNINYLGPGINSAGGKADWIHANSIDYNEELDQIAISSRALSELWIIDHSTTTEEAATSEGGNSGMGGDILYRWGNPISYNRGVAEDRVLFGQHNVHWVNSGFPGQNNLLLFNNGRNRPQGDYSTVDELVPPLNGYNYNIEANNPFGPSDLAWTYVAPNPTDFYADHISGCQRLENGNTLICSGPQGRFFEVDEIGDLVWEYVNPVFGNNILNQGDTPPQDPFGGDFQLSNSVFRCEKIDADFIGFQNYQLSLGVPIEGPPYIYPSLCLETQVDEYFHDQHVTQVIDLLGRNTHKSSIYIEFYNDGTVLKKCYLD